MPKHVLIQANKLQLYEISNLYVKCTYKIEI